MSSNNTNNTKKRRVGKEGDNDGASGGERQVDRSVRDELKSLSSHMTSMMEHSRMQTQNMTNMMQMMQGMQGEITRLTEKCDRMEKSIEVMNESQNKMQVTQNTISENMNSRFDDVDNEQKYQLVLLRNQQWNYSAPRPPATYWYTIGEDEGSAATGFLTQIKQRTEEMRYGTSNGNVVIDVFDLPYNEAFLPHWQEFANALEQHHHSLKCLPKDTETKLSLCDMELPDTVLDLLSKALESTQFTKFGLQNNSFGQKGIEFVLNYLKTNQIMKEFGLFVNTIDNMEQIKQLCEIVEEHPNIEDVSLDECRGEGLNGYEMLQMIMNAGKYKLNGVDLSNNNISTGGGTFISDFLACNPMLQYLRLSHNQLDDNDAIAIAGALKHNTNLETLDLANNNISKSGWEALRKTEFDDTSLNSAADSNHTCYVKYPSGDDEIEGLDTSQMNGNLDSDFTFFSECVRQKKVYSVLSTRNRLCSNVGHFDEVPVEFLPEMLRTFQQYSNYHVPEHTPSQGTNDVNPLSLVFEVCRYWDKSLAVYELLSS